jgi:hypothetical protein
VICEQRQELPIIPSVIGRQAWLLHRLRLAASGALAAVKRRTLEPVNKVKTFPLLIWLSNK